MVRVLAAVVLLSASAAAADAPLRFRFRAGDAYTYAVTQTTTVAETTLDDKTSAPVTATSTTTLELTRRVSVTAVDADGSATVEVSILALKQELVRPGPRDRDGKPTEDRTVIDSGTPDGAKQLAGFLNKPVVRMTVDTQGRPSDVKRLVQPDGKSPVELPFFVTLPEASPTVGATWDRPPFAITLEPPFGTGESFEAVQSFTLKSVANEIATIRFTTALKAPPSDPALLPGLVPLLWEGEVRFGTENGRYLGCDRRSERMVENHSGVGSKLNYRSAYSEQVRGDKEPVR